MPGFRPNLNMSCRNQINLSERSGTLRSKPCNIAQGLCRLFSASHVQDENGSKDPKKTGRQKKTKNLKKALLRWLMDLGNASGNAQRLKTLNLFLRDRTGGKPACWFSPHGQKAVLTGRSCQSVAKSADRVTCFYVLFKLPPWTLDQGKQKAGMTNK